jgi:hypothetical protein
MIQLYQDSGLYRHAMQPTGQRARATIKLLVNLVARKMTQEQVDAWDVTDEELKLLVQYYQAGASRLEVLFNELSL